ncbi:metallophosphoesterase [Bacillus alkalicola]|uniref:Metallophosphoesterase n=1 Tax=Evansella alkalicola TaxID=745819 RepID=A0ABS6JQ23_9BACI|nr:metallophosphoesterase [Bacillus alkalicola]
MLFKFIIILFVLAFYSLYKANKNTHEIKLNTIIPILNTSEDKSIESLRVLQLSDMHVEHISISPEQLYNKLRYENIDMIALTGDFLDRPKSIPKLESYLNVIKKLAPKHGVYAVYGNHDYKLGQRNFQLLRKTLTKYNVIMMQNENHILNINGNKLQVIGIDDHHSKKHNVQLAYQGTQTNAYRLVLTHDPNIVLQMKDYDFDYMLSGHFHGGQICWPKPYHLMKFGKLVRLNLIKGLIKHEGKVFYINEGLGQTGINIRVGSRPEITIHELFIAPLPNEVILNKAI